MVSAPEESKPRYLDAQQVIYLPTGARHALLWVLGVVAACAGVAGLAFAFFPEWRDKVTVALSIAQTAAGAFAVVIFVLLAERQLSIERLRSKTDEFLDTQMPDILARIELPQMAADQTVGVQLFERLATVHGRRKDIFGANYEISLGDFRMRMWVGINVRRLTVIYFVPVDSRADVATIQEEFRFTFSGAQKVGYHTHFEYGEVSDEKFVSIWSTVMTEQGILGYPAEQLFWMQDIAMMTQSLARTALRCGRSLWTKTLPGPL